MKHFIFIPLLILLTISACTNTEDYFRQFNQIPEITVRKNIDDEFTTITSDSTKVTEKYFLYYNISDEEENLKIYIDCDKAFNYKVFDDEKKIEISAENPISGKFRIYTKDSFGDIGEMVMQLTFFKNKPPVAILEIEDIPGFNNEKRLDASKSYDTDFEFGGKITLYSFFVNGKEISKIYHSYMNYSFPQSGEYQIGLRVRDNDYEWSEITYKTLIIN